jgi:hypothetical protein
MITQWNRLIGRRVLVTFSSSRHVKEITISEVSPSGKYVKVGKPDSGSNAEWHESSELTLRELLDENEQNHFFQIKKLP